MQYLLVFLVRWAHGRELHTCCFAKQDGSWTSLRTYVCAAVPCMYVMTVFGIPYHTV